MKNILTTLFIFVSLTGFAQELTANTPAVEPSILTQILQALWACALDGAGGARAGVGASLSFLKP